MWERIETQIASALGTPFAIARQQAIGGGDINQGFRLEGQDGRCLFVKLNRADRLGMFTAEAAALDALAAIASGLHIPRPIAQGVSGDRSFLALDWLDLGAGSPDSWYQLGVGLATLHRQSASPRSFGWERDNWIGTTPQPNPWTDTWAEFWQRHRIGYQLKLARRNGADFPNGDRLLAAIPSLLAGHEPQPSLCHGDLWGGNAGIGQDGRPSIFDPASYYGDREVDLAMTELFGGFPRAFYDGYRATWPLERGYEQRRELYNLYHLLNHFNLFGGGYARQSATVIDRLLKDA